MRILNTELKFFSYMKITIQTKLKFFSCMKITIETKLKLFLCQTCCSVPAEAAHEPGVRLELDLPGEAGHELFEG